MKKLKYAILAFLTVFTLTACGTGAEDVPTDENLLDSEVIDSEIVE